MILLFLALISFFLTTCANDQLIEVPPAPIGMGEHKLAQIDAAVNQAIEDKQCPGAVVFVSRFCKVVWFRAYGNRAVEPHVELMTRDTIFDIASLTKPLATATAIMMLVEQGKISLADFVIKYIPEFGCKGKKYITIEQLLCHKSGLAPDSPVHNYENMHKTFEHICTLPLLFKPGTSFCYSCIGYIVLCEVIRRVSGKPLDVFTHEHIFAPLQMHNTMFNPPKTLINSIAPTEKRNNKWIRGQVHDPRTHSLGGVSGNAGLFSCAYDIATFAHMILNNGSINNVHLLSKQSIKMMTSPHNTQKNQQYGLGWDYDVFESSPPHNNIPLGGFGHQGFTGTFLWIDPTSQTVIITLTNRLHPDRTGNAIPLQKKIIAIIAGALTDTS